MEQIVNYFGAGGLFFLLLCVFVEITPVKINPLQWLGKQIFKPVSEKIDDMDKKLDEHIAQSYRNKILSFQNELLHNVKHTQEQFDEVLSACEQYEDHCEQNKVKNDKCKFAIEFIQDTYKKCLNERSFATLPLKKKEGTK